MYPIILFSKIYKRKLNKVSSDNMVDHSINFCTFVDHDVDLSNYIIRHQYTRPFPERRKPLLFQSTGTLLLLSSPDTMSVIQFVEVVWLLVLYWKEESVGKYKKRVKITNLFLVSFEYIKPSVVIATRNFSCSI